MYRAQLIKEVIDHRPKSLQSQNIRAATWWEENWQAKVFTDEELMKRIPESIYEIHKSNVKERGHLDSMCADVIANAMKDWAISNGATHYTHWFQPIHMSTAEKHDAFISVTDDLETIMEFSGSSLIRGEPDASSFPNGGIRSTSQARGYTTWDPSSPPFIRMGKNGSTMYIPSCFCSWTGDALDVKTPLLRSLRSLSENAVRLLRMLGDDKVTKVIPTLGAEQEFFLIDRSFYTARPDLVYTGRTILGAKSPKGQDVADHYYARIPPRVLAYLQEVEMELWELGVPTQGRHNEAAPSQYEMSPIFETANLATDHNMIQMDVLRDVAERHGLTCLLHEKPFKGVNGSGKHNNWSLTTDYGLNLLEPSAQMKDNIVFQVFIACVIRAVDLHGDILRAFVATPGNDLRLGQYEAPPAIMSIYLGSDITELVDYLCETDIRIHEGAQPAASSILNLGCIDVPPFERDRTDRNRTSPFAFTGNKFEFRAAGSSQSGGHTCTAINAIVSESIHTFCEKMEKKMSKGLSSQVAAKKVVASFLRKHRRIVFNGNNYSDTWKMEAKRRNLPFLQSTVEALEQLKTEKNVKLFDSLSILSPDELLARSNIYLEHYCRTINVEAKCMLNLARQYVLSSSLKYQKRVAGSILKVREAIGDDKSNIQEDFLFNIKRLNDKLLQQIDILAPLTNLGVQPKDDFLVKARWYRDEIISLTKNMRDTCDKLEEMVDNNLWVLPKYADILYLK